MKILLTNPPSGMSRRSSTCSSWTLIELMVAVAAGTIALGTTIATSVTVSRTMVAVGSYNDLNKYSRNTLDVLSRDIRGAAALTNYMTSMIALTNLDGTSFRYAWDGSNTFTRVFTRGSNVVATVMLTNCDFLVFNIFQRNPTNNFQFVPATSTPKETELISVSWRCSRQLLGSKIYTESVQTAQIALRNN